MESRRFAGPLRSVFRLLLRTVPLNDPWKRYPQAVPLARYGLGAQRDFRWYFEGESRVAVASVEEVQAWLGGCEYMRDPDLFNEPDYWQHPSAFEQLRKGDCEDFALWTWRKLVELGYEAELVAGRYAGCTGPAVAGHAWVHFRDRETHYLFDPVLEGPHQMVRALPEVRGTYLPEVSVDGRFNRYVYGGFFQQLRAEGSGPASGGRPAGALQFSAKKRA